MVATLSPLQELAEAAQAATSFLTKAEFNLPDGRTLLAQLSGYQVVNGWTGFIHTGEGVAGTLQTWNHGPAAKDVGTFFRQTAAKYPGAVLRPDSITVSIHKGPTTAAKLIPLVEQGWHEAFGLPVPSNDDIIRRRKEAKAAERAADEATRLLLATGKAGVKAFNSRSQRERSRLDFRKVKLTGFPLTGVNFAGVRLESADLSGSFLSGATFRQSGAFGRLSKARFVAADLTGALLIGCRCADADFSRADLSRAEAMHSTFTRACFIGANLKDARFTHADLRGADFTGATLTEADLAHATFDNATKWPKGFKPPAELVWKGDGPDPRLANSRREKTRSRPTDFAGFLNRLKLVADRSKLDKATDMLKADRFRLFARVEDDHVVGVVKSQSDGSLVYSCRIAADGTYACCTQNLNVCGGLRGSPCKHLLVLIVGLAQAGELDPGTAHDWVHSSRGRKPALDKDVMTETFLLYKGAEAGEVDWRPTETLPEDFYAI